MTLLREAPACPNAAVAQKKQNTKMVFFIRVILVWGKLGEIADVRAQVSRR
jgi:hypothetical protein